MLYGERVASEYDSFYGSKDFKKENRQLWRMLRNHISGKVLDVGCGTGLFLEMLNNGVDEYMGLDISRYMLRQARNKFPQHLFIEGRVTEISGKFGSIVSLFGSVSYLNDLEMLMLELLCSRAKFYFLMAYKDGYSSKILKKKRKRGYRTLDRCRYFKKKRFYEFGNYIVITNKTFPLNEIVLK